MKTEPHRIWGHWLPLALGFAAGLAMGLALGPLVLRVLPPFPPRVADMVARFSRDLDLSPDQRRELSAILERTRGRLADLHRDVRPKLEAIREAADAEIEKILTRDQVERFRRIRKHMVPPGLGPEGGEPGSPPGQGPHRP